ncbi:MAG: hypothetical protein CMP34_02495 [Rickettsiales bacterium]|nr:hypothetical protein [Rickettsiales bacterium]
MNKERFKFLINNLFIKALFPINILLSLVFRHIKKKKNILHISYPIHQAYRTVKILKLNKISSIHYLSIGKSSTWSKFDFNFPRGYNFYFYKEFFFLWTFLIKYKIIHIHFLYTPSITGWEILFLKLSGTKIIIHFRGNEARDNKTILKLLSVGKNSKKKTEKILSNEHRDKKHIIKYANKILVTTRDLLDFYPEATHIPFFSINEKNYYQTPKKFIKIIHASNQPIIEGTNQIIKVINQLKNEGFLIDFIYLKDKKFDEVINELKSCHLSIGKLRMGDYANFQVESMSLGIPTITFVRNNIIKKNPYISESGLFISNLSRLKDTLKFILQNKEILNQRSKMVKKFVNKYHNNTVIAKKLKSVYMDLGYED